ncbi:MAG TPA: TerB family tellurite resistance protein [Kofleriaceae bacterium]|nr:TerB family tellurite resistance protein [Kofleriaceae bacterium]
MASYEKRTWWSKHELTDRLKDETFLEAAVTCAFLVAAADGNQSEQEYDALLDRLEILGGVDRDKIDELLTDASHDVEERGFEPRIARVAELLSGKHAHAEAALMLGMAIALADDDVSKEEREVATQLSAALGLGLLTLDGMIAEIRG